MNDNIITVLKIFILSFIWLLISGFVAVIHIADGYQSAIGMIGYIFLTFLLIKKFMDRLSPRAIFLIISMGIIMPILPVIIFNFKGILNGFLWFILLILGSIIGYRLYLANRIEKMSLITISVLLSAFIIIKGQEMWYSLVELIK